MVVAGNSDKGLRLQYAPAGRTLPSAVIAPRARECCCPPQPTDVLAPRRRSYPSSQTPTGASRPVGFVRLGRAVVRSARALAPVPAGPVRILSYTRLSMAFSFDPTPSTPLGFLAKLTPSWGGQAESGAKALWGRDTMTDLANGGHAAGGRLAADLSYGMAVGSRFVGTPRIGIGTSGTGRDYRFGYSLGLLGREGLGFELGLDAHRREQANLNGTDHALVGRFTARW